MLSRYFLARLVLVCAGLVGLAVTSMQPSFAVETSTSTRTNEPRTTSVSRAYINPFRERKNYRIFVLGDSIGDQLWKALKKTFANQSDIEIVNRSRAGTGFAKADRFNWTEEVASVLALERVDVAVVTIGINDRRAIRRGQRSYPFNSPEWIKEYTARIDEFFDQLNRNSVAVYWVGLPIMRKPILDRDLKIISQLYQKRALARGVKFTDIRHLFSDNKGAYQAFGVDRTGRNRRMRAADGVHFTTRGADRVANLVGREIRADIARTKAESNIELAGEVDLVTVEVTPHNPNPDPLTWKGDTIEPAPKPTSSQQRFASFEDLGIPGADIQPQTGTQPKISALIREMQTVTSATIASLVKPTRAVKQDRAEMPLHVKVLLLGEPVAPKPGRADDFSWPPKDIPNDDQAVLR